MCSVLMFLCDLGEHLEAIEGASTASGSSIGVVIGIIIAVLIILLIVTDVSCYFINGCGALAAVCSQVRGHSSTSKDKTMEEGDRYLAVALAVVVHIAVDISNSYCITANYYLWFLCVVPLPQLSVNVHSAFRLMLRVVLFFSHSQCSLVVQQLL